jgi:hypothetical protein
VLIASANPKDLILLLLANEKEGAVKRIQISVLLD